MAIGSAFVWGWLFAAPTFDPSVFQAGALVRKKVASDGILLIDVENVRGKSGFALSHAELLDSVTAWTKLCELQGQVTLVVDHGSGPDAFWLEDRGLAVVFAGPSRKADDVIADDVGFLGKEADVVIVTADNGLIQRCRRSAVKKGLTVLPPITFLADLDVILPTLFDPPEPVDHPSEILADTADMTESLASLKYEIRIGAELLEAEALLRGRNRVNNKRKKKLQSKVRLLREKLATCPAVLDRVTGVLSHGKENNSLDGLSSELQKKLLAKWEQTRKISQRKERTGDRVLLAENLRRDLAEQYADTTTRLSASLRHHDLAKTHVLKRVTPKQRFDAVPLASSLRLVVVSDTHGFENAVTSVNGTLPQGDVLLHLGDFAADHDKKGALVRFDQWLAKQPHPTKIVVRGNHDPRVWIPLLSEASFVTKPTVISVAGFDFALVPYVPGSLSNRMMPRQCDVMVSHVPPRNILDRCYTGRAAGSSTLRRGVERMKSRTPCLWLCGHIHESRGAIRHCFVGDRETLVVNAANANCGRAESIEHGPVVLDLHRQNRLETHVDIVDMEHQHVFLNNKKGSLSFFDISETEETKDLLLAVDLGLRTGFALFSDDGRLLRYEGFECSSSEDLQQEAEKRLEVWEEWVNNEVVTSELGSWRLSHVAVEGEDVELRQVWHDLTEAERAFLNVKPEEWRADLLNGKEKLSGQSAKEAARLVARQIIADFGNAPHVGKLNTDVAEAILVGYHVARRMGWIQREPAVRRYTNGKIVVPATRKVSSTVA